MKKNVGRAETQSLGGIFRVVLFAAAAPEEKMSCLLHDESRSEDFLQSHEKNIHFRCFQVYGA